MDVYFHLVCASLLTLANILSLVTLTPVVACPIGWTALQTGCYRFVEASTFNLAITRCREKGGFTAELKSQIEQDAFSQFMKDSGFSKKNVWLGASLVGNEWIWFHSKQKMTFSAWIPGQPSGRGETCVAAWGLDDTTLWNDILCDQHGTMALCQYSPVPGLTTSPTLASTTSIPMESTASPIATESVKVVDGYPYLLIGSSWRPICGHYFWNNNYGASLFCKKLGYSMGGSVTIERKAYKEDAHYVGTCKAGEITDFNTGCIKGNSENYFINECRKGQPVSIKIICKGTPSSTTQIPSCPPTVQSTCPPTPICPTITTPTCPSLPKSTCPPTVTCPDIPEPTKCPTLTTTLSPTCPPTPACPTIPEPTKCPTLITKPIPTCPAIQACPTTVSPVNACADKGCKNAFKGLGMCLDTSIADWTNVSKIIDFTAETKDGKCGEGCNCKCFKHTGCFSEECDAHNGICLIQELEDDNDNKAFFIPSGYSKAFPCDESLDCHCYLRNEPITQKPRKICKQTKKCAKRKGKCYGIGEKAPEGAKFIRGMCGRKTGCKCYRK